MKEMLHFFGYAKVPSDPDNLTGFFDYSGEEESQITRQYKGWRIQNTDMVNWSCQLTDHDLEQIQFKMQDPRKDIKFFYGEAYRTKKMILHYYEKQIYNKVSEH